MYGIYVVIFSLINETFKRIIKTAKTTDESVLFGLVNEELTPMNCVTDTNMDFGNSYFINDILGSNIFGVSLNLNEDSQYISEILDVVENEENKKYFINYKVLISGWERSDAINFYNIF